jgi:hypothetical protein
MKIAALLTFVAAPKWRSAPYSFREPHLGPLLYPARYFALRGKQLSRRYVDVLPTASSGLNATSSPVGAVLTLG